MTVKIDGETEPHPVKPIPESYWVVPGRLLAGEYPAIPFAVETTQARLDAFLEAGFTSYFNLTRPDELPDYAALLKERAGYYGLDIECRRYQIGDFGLPSPDLMNSILYGIDETLERGRKLYVHCHGGIGRTGTTVGCYLVRHGYSGEETLRKLASLWQTVPKSAFHPRSPETSQQEEFILNWPQSRDRSSREEL